MTTQASDIDGIVADRELSWMDRYLPAWLRPFGVLARWDRPIGAWLLFWPCVWGLGLSPGWPSVWLACLFLVGAFAMRGAGCTINDMTDRDLDAKVERTRNRPLASGALTLSQALLFLGVQLLVGLVVLLQLNVNAIIVGFLAMPLVVAYPWMKRITWWPQLFLGLTFKWGALVGWTAATGSLGWPAVVLYLAGICWTLGYDTIYAHQDKADDALIGVKSTARRFGEATPAWLWGFYGMSLLLLAAAGALVGMGWLFYLALLPVAAHFAWQIRTLDIDDPDNCLARFRSNREAGLLVMIALLAGKVFLNVASSDWFDPRKMPVVSTLPTVGSLQRNVEDLVNLTLDRTVRLAVTGLRQSGKTVFITTLIHHLLSSRELPFFTPVKQKRLMGARALPAYVGDPPPFPYEMSLASLMSDQPVWPEPTRGLSSLRLELRVAETGFLARQFSEYRSQQVEIIDYPGEWLLDLPMMEQSFEDWSAVTIALAKTAERRDLARDWLSAVDENITLSASDRDRAATLAELYRRYLSAAQAAGFSLLQPGRLTMPGDMAGAEHLNFCPMPPADGRLYTLMSDRFEHYRDRVVRPFYQDHFSRFDRQIVLVDLISALNRGRAVFEDTQTALRTVMESFRYGPSSLIARLFRPRIETLLFAATKADHVAHNQHHNLRLLLEQMVHDAAGQARFEGVQPVFMAIASLRSTDMVKTDHHGQTLSCVRGRIKGEDRETVLFPGEIPPDLPVEEDWADGRFHFRDFAPRRLQRNGAEQPQHIRLDQALDVLLGDRLT